MTNPLAALHVKNQKALFESTATDFLCGNRLLVGYIEGFRPQTQSKLELDNFILWDSIIYCGREGGPFNRGEKSLRHVAMVAIFLDDNKPKIHLKSEFALFQTSSILFNFI